MSLRDNRLQSNSSLSETEARLTHNKSKINLTLYEKNSMNKVNLRSFLGKNYICSAQDNYRKIRIPILSLFLKLLSTPSPQNLDRLNKIKQLIYSQKLQEIVTKHGITAEELLTNFAFTMGQFELGSDKIESQFIKKINSQPFFDKIIMESFYQMFFDPGQENSLTSNISKWIKQQLGISIVFVQNETEPQTQNMIFLRKTQKNQILRILKSFNICSLTSILDDSLSVETPVKKINTQRYSRNEKVYDNLLKSISSCQSPTFRNSSNRKIPNEHLVAISLQTSLENIENKQNTQPNNKSDSQTCIEPITMRKQQKSSESKFWKIFCCGGD